MAAMAIAANSSLPSALPTTFPFTVHNGDRSRLADYEILSELGEGKYAKVYECQRKSDGAHFALKRIRIFDMSSQERKECMTEAEILFNIRHPHIIHCDTAFLENNELYLILELAEGGDLAQLIQAMRAREQLFAEVDIWRIVYVISLALSHLHRSRIMHRDIKPANIYVTKNGELKIGDLGMGRIFSSHTAGAASLVGTPYYMSPELIEGATYSYSSDIWSLGCLLYEVSTLRVPFALESTQAGNMFLLGQKILKVDYPAIDENYSAQLKELIRRMLLRDGAQRPNAEQIGEVARKVLTAMMTPQQDTTENDNTQNDKRVVATSINGSGSSTTNNANDVITEDNMAISQGSLHHVYGTNCSSSSSAAALSHPASSSSAGFSLSSSACSSSISSLSSPSSSLPEVDPYAFYESLAIIGRGKHSEVHKARSKSNGEYVALKQVRVFDMDSDSRKECMNEARIMQSLPPHPHIIRYLASFLYQNDLFLVFELADSGDLQSLLDDARKQSKAFSEEEIWYYFAQICDALALMHKCRIMHRDIKPGNVFLSCGGNGRRIVKLGDLGLGRYMSSKTYEAFSMVGTPYYMSPEAISNTGYDFKSDIWSLGCLLYEFAALRSPFYSANLNYYTLGLSIKKAEYAQLPSHFSETLRNLVRSMIQVKPEDRPDIQQVFNIAKQAHAACTQQMQHTSHHAQTLKF